MKLICCLCSLLLLELTVPAFATVINSTTVAGNQLTITGTGFTATPLTVTLNASKLAIISNTV